MGEKRVDTSCFKKKKLIMSRAVLSAQKREERSMWVVGRSIG